MTSWIVLCLVAAVLLGAAQIVRKYMLAKEYALEFLAARGFVMLLLLLLLVPWVNMSVDVRILGMIYISSLIITIGYYYQTRAQRHTDISYLAPLQNLSPLILFFIAYLFLEETHTAVEFVGMVCLVLGTYMIAVENSNDLLGPIKQLGNENWVHIILAVVLIAVAAVLDKYLVGQVQPVTYLFFLLLFMNLNYIVADWLFYDWRHLTEDFKDGWQWLLLSGALYIAALLVFYHALSLPGVLVSLAMPLRRLSALIETVFGGTLFHEANVLRRVFACIVMVVGIVLIAA